MLLAQHHRLPLSIQICCSQAHTATPHPLPHHFLFEKPNNFSLSIQGNICQRKVTATIMSGDIQMQMVIGILRFYYDVLIYMNF